MALEHNTVAFINLLDEGLSQEISSSSALKFFITNIDHDNETPEFAADQIRQAKFYLNQEGQMQYFRK